MKHKNVVGQLINFRGLVYSPVEENGVIFLFSKLTNDLNLYIETIRKGFPDCIAKRYVGGGQWEEVNIEFEFKSSDFKRHHHLARYGSGAKCDMIVCWEHDWLDCPKEIEVLELKSEYKNYPNEEVEEPDTLSSASEHKLEEHYKNYVQSKDLYEGFHRMISQTDKEVWRKVAAKTIDYFCPEKVFLYLRIQKQGLKGHIYTGGKRIKGVEAITERDSYAQKWGRFYIMNEKQLKESKAIIRKSLSLIRKAIEANENTGWYSEIE